MAGRLIVLRHAKSAWPAGVPDEQRPLNDRGRNDAAAAGDWIARNCGVPNLVAVSPAVRTVSTWEKVAAQLPHAPDSVDINSDIYEATADQLLGLVERWPREVATGLLIGHNPGLEDLVCYLAGIRSIADAMEGVESVDKFATSTAAVFAIDAPWAHITRVSTAHVSLTALHKCRP